MFYRVEVPVADRFVRQGPQALAGLEFGRAGRQEDKLHALGHLDLRACVPARLIHHQQDLLESLIRLAASHKGGKLAQHQIPRFDVNPRGQPPETRAIFGAHEAVKIAPLVSVFDRSDGALPSLGPHAPQNRLESDAVFVIGPHFDGHSLFFGLFFSLFHTLG